MIKFMSLSESGKVHPAEEQEDGTWKSLCGKTAFKFDSLVWFKKEDESGAPMFTLPTSPVMKYVSGGACGFKTCKDFIASAGHVESTPASPLQTMEA